MTRYGIIPIQSSLVCLISILQTWSLKLLILANMIFFIVVSACVSKDTLPKGWPDPKIVPPQGSQVTQIGKHQKELYIEYNSTMSSDEMYSYYTNLLVANGYQDGTMNHEFPMYDYFSPDYKTEVVFFSFRKLYEMEGGEKPRCDYNLSIETSDVEFPGAREICRINRQYPY